MPDNKLTTIYVANSQPEAQIVKGRLEAEGIPVMLKYESLGLVYGFTIDGLGQVKIQVPAFLAQKANLVGKIGGAFGSYTHSGESVTMIFDTMLHVFKMDMVDLGPLSLKEAIVDTQDGMRAGQDYGKAVGQKLAP